MVKSSSNSSSRFKEKEKIILFDIDYTLFDIDLFKKTRLQKYSLYNEVKEVLASLKKIAKLGIFSEGEYEFQKIKLIKTKINEYFDKKYIHIVEEKDTSLDEVLHKYKKDIVYFVDDKLTILYKAKKINPSLFVIWVKRGIYADLQRPIKNFTPDGIIDNLNELIPTIQSFQ